MLCLRSTTRALLVALTALSYAHAFVVQPEQQPFSAPQQAKSIAVVGAGTAGLGALKALLEVKERLNQSWDIVLYESRRDVGGVWLDDVHEPRPPKLPETPLYPGLVTNTPHPLMTYPHFPFPPQTPIFPAWEDLEAYHAHYAAAYNLAERILFNHSVVRAAWVGDTAAGSWNVTVRDGRDEVFSRQIDHLVVASGHNHYPYVPTWPGQGEWKAADSKRELLHSVFWRHGEKYANKTVVVVGGGASARDIVLHTSPYAHKVYISLKDGNQLPSRLHVPVTQVGDIAYFTPNAVHLSDGSALTGIDAVLLATGYELLIPFLTHGGALHVDRAAHSCPRDPPALTTNTRYVFPLHEHVFSLAAAHPPAALTFVGLPSFVANAPSDYAQGLFVAHAIADARILPARDTALEQLREREAKFWKAGLDPYVVGHRLIDPEQGIPTPGNPSGPGVNAGSDYQDTLIDYLKKVGALPDDGKPYVERWRRRGRDEMEVLWNAWHRVQSLGPDAIHEWLDGVKTESDWVDLLDRLIAWEREQRKKEGKPDFDGADDDFSFF